MSRIHLETKPIDRALAARVEKRLEDPSTVSVTTHDGLTTIEVIVPGETSLETNNFIHNMVRWWANPGMETPLLATRQCHFEHKDKTHLYSQVTFECAADLSPLIEEMRQGLESPPLARALLDSKVTGSDQKTQLVFEWLSHLRQKKPQDFGSDIFKEAQSLFLHCDDHYRALRSARHLCRIITTHYLLKKVVRQQIRRFPHKRCVRARIVRTHLDYPTGKKGAVGVIVCMNVDRKLELFRENHLTRAIQHAVPAAQCVEHSYFASQDYDSLAREIYIEIVKADGTEFSSEEITRLRKELPDEIKQNVEQINQPLFMMRNEEDVIRSILILSKELKFVRDLPQIIITYREQTPHTLLFNLIVVRVMRGAPSITELTQKQTKGVSFHLEYSRSCGLLRKKHPKEASVLRVKLTKKRFLRRDNSVDLYKARQVIVSHLEEVIGEVRDYNGGLIQKQHEQLIAVKQALRNLENRHEHLLENFFHSLLPSEMQSFLQPEQMAKWFSLILQLLPCEPDHTHDAKMLQLSLDGCVVVMIRSEDKTFKHPVNEAVGQLGVDLLQLASAFVKVHGSSYLGYFYLTDSEQDKSRFCRQIQDALGKWEKRLAERQILRINLPRDETPLDPRIGTDARSGILIKMLYEGLMRLGPGGTPEPAIAERVEVSKDHTHYQFHLRSSQWSNGTPLTAYDFEYAWKQVLRPDFTAQFCYLFYPIKNGREAKKGRLPLTEVGVQALDDHTLSVQLEYPAPYFLDLVCNWIYSPLCREIDRNNPGWAYTVGKGYVCNGPFLLVESHSPDTLKLIRNPKYWDAEAVRLEEIEVLSIEDSHKAVELFNQDGLDWCGEPLNDLPQDIMGHELLESIPSGQVLWYNFNTSALPFSSKTMRQAFAHAIDRHKLQLEGAPAHSILPPPLALSHARIDTKPALALFEQGLDELNLSRSDLKITINCANSPARIALCKAIAKQWRDAFGIKVRVESLPWKGYVQALQKKQFQVADLVWSSWLADPVYNLEYAKYGHDRVNATRWEDPYYVNLLDKANTATDSLTRHALLRQAEHHLQDEMPLVPICHQNHKFLRRPRLKGVLISPLGQIDFKTAEIQ